MYYALQSDNFMKAKVVPVLLILNFFISLALAFSPSDFLGVNVVRVKDGISTDLFTNFLKTKEYSLLILGTYAADFNAIEYAQRLRYPSDCINDRFIWID